MTMKESIAPQIAEDFRKVYEHLANCDTMIAEKTEEQRAADWGITDIMHKIEMGQVSEEEAVDTINAIAYFRKQRRSAKNDISFLNTIRDFNSKNNLYLKRMDSLATDLEKILSIRDKRTYTPRLTAEQLSFAYEEASSPEEIPVMQEVTVENIHDVIISGEEVSVTSN